MGETAKGPDLADDPSQGQIPGDMAEVPLCQHSFHLVKMEKSG
jgi:hypothetical protein